MAREHAAIRLDMWGDDDWRGLTRPAQHLYMHLLSSPSLTYAGAADWRPARLAGVSRGTTAADVREAAAELSGALFVVYDDDTEEILIRSFLKYDGLLHKPNVAKAMVTAFGKVVSPTLRGVVVHELSKLHDRHPEWKAFALAEVRELLTRPSVNPSEIRNRKGSAKGSESDPSLLTPNSLLPSPNSTHLTTSTNEVRDDVRYLCELLQSLIVANGSKEPPINDGWLNAARLMLDKDERELTAAERLMRWCQDDPFWKSNILSMPTFRAKYDQLRLHANRQVEERKLTNAEQALELSRRIGEEANRGHSADFPALGGSLGR